MHLPAKSLHSPKSLRKAIQRFPHRRIQHASCMVHRFGGGEVDRIGQLGETIRDLCGRVLAAEDAEFERFIIQLRQALRDHFSETRKLVVNSYPITPANTER